MGWWGCGRAGGRCVCIPLADVESTTRSIFGLPSRPQVVPRGRLLFQGAEEELPLPVGPVPVLPKKISGSAPTMPLPEPLVLMRQRRKGDAKGGSSEGKLPKRLFDRMARLRQHHLVEANRSTGLVGGLRSLVPESTLADPPSDTATIGDEPEHGEELPDALGGGEDFGIDEVRTSRSSDTLTSNPAPLRPCPRALWPLAVVGGATKRRSFFSGARGAPRIRRRWGGG